MKIKEIIGKYREEWLKSEDYSSLQKSQCDDPKAMEEENFNQGFKAALNYARNPPIMSLEYLGFHYVTKFRNENPFDFKKASEDATQEYLEQMVKYACACVESVYEYPLMEENDDKTGN